MHINTYKKIMRETMAINSIKALYNHQYKFAIKYKNDVNYLELIREIKNKQIDYVMRLEENNINNFQYEDR